MGMGLSDRLRAGIGTMDEWRRDRLTDLAQSAAELQAKGHQLYGEGLRKGQDMLVQTTSQVREFAKQHGVPQAAPVRSAAPPGPRPPRPSGTPKRSISWDQQLLENAKRIAADGPPIIEAALRRAGETKPVRQVAGFVAGRAGNAAGIGTGAAHMGQDLVDGAVFGLRLIDPTDRIRSLPGEAAWDQVFDAALTNVGVVGDAIVHPRAAAERLSQAGQKFLRDTVPSATPEAPSTLGEIRRQYRIGQNQGELAVQAVPYLVGAGELKAAADIAAVTKASLLEKYAGQGFSRTQTNRLAKLYDGMGHHSPLPRRARFPVWLGGGPVPRAILDSEFNVLKPRGISQGNFYELHYKADPKMKTARLRGRQWSGEELGLVKYELPERIWYGTPNATKRAVAGGGMLGTLPLDEGDGE